jgi:glycosyltransferase involved in cell wall biosynthesis
MTYKQSIWKLRIEQTLMFPFVLAGRAYGRLFPLQTKRNVFLFFPSADIGGAPQVNADITRCIQDSKPLIIFSKKPRNNKFRELFDIDGVGILDLHPQIDHKIFHFVNFFYRGVLATCINRAVNPVVFGGESLFFYKVIPYLNKDVRVLELCHLDTWFPYTIGFIDRINIRIFSTQKLKDSVVALYQKNHISEQLYKRLNFVENAIDIPEYSARSNPQLEVVFIGRGSPQKRVHLAVAIARIMHEKGAPAHFSFVGDVENMISPADFPYCRFYGNVRDEEKLESIYQQSDVLLMTSLNEGLPVVVMKMMAHGKVVLSTAINAIPDYIVHNQNGLLISATDEQAIVEEAVRWLEFLLENPELRSTMGKRSREIAFQKFNRETFCRQYHRLFFEA